MIKDNMLWEMRISPSGKIVKQDKFSGLILKVIGSAVILTAAMWIVIQLGAIAQNVFAN